MNFYNCLKFSFIQYLLNKDIEFFARKREIVFQEYSNDNKVIIQNEIAFPSMSSVIFQSSFPIEYSYLSKENLMDIVNAINNYSSSFNAYVKHYEEDGVQILYIKDFTNLVQGQVIDEEFWKENLFILKTNISNIINFIYFELSKSGLRDKKFDKKLKEFLEKCISDYTKAAQLVKEEIQKGTWHIQEDKIENWSKEKLEQEIDEELSKWSKGEKNEEKLKELTSYLKKKEDNNDIKYS